MMNFKEIGFLGSGQEEAPHRASLCEFWND